MIFFCYAHICFTPSLSSLACYPLDMAIVVVAIFAAAPTVAAAALCIITRISINLNFNYPTLFKYAPSAKAFFYLAHEKDTHPILFGSVLLYFFDFFAYA